MLGPEADEFEFMRMHQSEYQNRPDLYFVLYKYKPINDFLWKTLETSEMWFSHYSKLNDEAEYMYEIESVNRASLKRLKRIIAPYVGFPQHCSPMR